MQGCSTRPGSRGATLRIINSLAPIRVCDNGGWTDTWFAEYGSIFNIAVYPGAEVQMRVFPSRGAAKRITIRAENYGELYSILPPRRNYSKHPLLEAAFEQLGIPDDIAVDVSIFSEAPAGCSTGTSAAVTIALIGALDMLTPGCMSPLEVASAAHRIETVLLRQQCGIQDQLASAFGGINLIEMHRYPDAIVHRVDLPDSIWWELESRLALIFVGESHNSSAVHEMVIRGLEREGPGSPRLATLRRTAGAAREALVRGDFSAFGRSMIENTEAQRNLHPALVGAAHSQIIEIAREHGAAGWKVNGAGGDGGSVTILSGPDRSLKRAMVAAIEALNPSFRNIPVRLARVGLRRWEAPAIGDAAAQ